MRSGDVLSLFKPFLDTVTRIYQEFEELEIKQRQDWLHERYAEFRKMTKILLAKVLQDTQGAGRRSSAKLDWFDTILTLNNLIVNFNLSLTGHTDQARKVIPLCVSDLLL